MKELTEEQNLKLKIGLLLLIDLYYDQCIDQVQVIFDVKFQGDWETFSIDKLFEAKEFLEKYHIKGLVNNQIELA